MSIFFRLRGSRCLRSVPPCSALFPLRPVRPASTTLSPSAPSAFPTVLLSSPKAPVLELVATPPSPRPPPPPVARALPPPSSLVSLLISARALRNSFLSDAFSSRSADSSVAVPPDPSPPAAAATLSGSGTPPAGAKPQEEAGARSPPALSAPPGCRARLGGDATAAAGFAPRVGEDAVGTGVIGRLKDSKRADTPGFFVEMSSWRWQRGSWLGQGYGKLMGLKMPARHGGCTRIITALTCGNNKRSVELSCLEGPFPSRWHIDAMERAALGLRHALYMVERRRLWPASSVSPDAARRLSSVTIFSARFILEAFRAY